jgi:hypothetical protein
MQSNLKNDYTLSNSGVVITLQKNKIRLTFDRIFKTGQGFVAGVNLAPKAVRDSAFLGLETKRTTMNAAHSCMTHIGEDATRLTAKHCGLTVSGKLDPCTHCGMAKARQSNLSKTTDNRYQKPNQRRKIVHSCFMDTRA